MSDGFTLFPQLSWPVAVQLAEQYRATAPAELFRMIEESGMDLDQIYYSAVGGTRFQSEQLQEFRSDLVNVVLDLGFPEQPADRDATRKFDNHLVASLHREMQITSNQASLDGVWQTLTCIVAPDLVRWRFPGATDAGTSLERFRGGVRNTFQRLWWRAEILGNIPGFEPYTGTAALNEDEIIQIMERPSVRANRRLSQAVCAEFLVRVDESGVEREALMRESQKRIIRLLPFLGFDTLDDTTLRRTTSRIVVDAAKALSAARERD